MALALDGKAINESWGQTTTATVTLTTADTNDIVVVLVGTEQYSGYNGGAQVSVSSVAKTSGTGTVGTFVQRAVKQNVECYYAKSASNPCYNNLEVWWAAATTALTSAVLTVTVNNAPDNGWVVAFGVNGVGSLTSPWDPNASLPDFKTGAVTSATTPTVTGVTTTNAADFLIWAICDSSANNYATAPTNYTNVENDINSSPGAYDVSGIVSYDIVAATQSNATVAYGTGLTSNGWIAYVDALTATAPGGTTPSLTLWWDQRVVKKPSEFLPGPFAGNSPALSSPYVQAPFFDLIRPKQPQVEAPPIMMPAIFIHNYVTSSFFDSILLKRPTVEAPPIIPGTNPALASPYVQAPFFDPVRPKQPIIVNPDNVPPFPPAVSGINFDRWFDQVMLRRINVEAPPIIPGTVPALNSPRSFDLWFEPNKLLKVPDRLLEAFGRPFPPPILETASWFDVLRLLQPRDRFGESFPPIQFPAAPQSLSAWFYVLRKLLVANGLDFTIYTPQTSTILYALADWFERAKLIQPLVETPGIFYYPAQVTPPPVAPAAPQQVLRGGQWDPSNWYVRSEEHVRKAIRGAILKAMGKGASEATAHRAAAEFANSAANPHLESLMPGKEAEYLSHFVRANAHAVHAAIDRVEAQERDDEETLFRLAEEHDRAAYEAISKFGRHK
jgi:hypothetical protein